MAVLVLLAISYCKDPNEHNWLQVLFFMMSASGLLIVPNIIVFIVLLDVVDAEEWNGEIQSWMIKYISWGVLAFN